MGKRPMVLKMAIHINHASSLLRPAFHIPISFQVESQITHNTMIGINHPNVLTK